LNCDEHIQALVNHLIIKYYRTLAGGTAFHRKSGNNINLTVVLMNYYLVVLPKLELEQRLLRTHGKLKKKKIP